MRETPSRDLVKTLMHQLLDRTRRERSSHLALLELRLEATRRPELDIRLTRFFTSDLEANVAFHVDAGLPGSEKHLARLKSLADEHGTGWRYAPLHVFLKESPGEATP